ncbi:hypothetical protein Pmani_026420 [Petrolisthes manimaculis]|uniref:Uncharacterized protein n=1 Tax=Petrolisthes manimaculis TaxID=1843537 RepID=A0AAE1P629_9EUCA|nr:hypothetical protein Pmani_026420 [Petrolisthes manimaculis]
MVTLTPAATPTQVPSIPSHTDHRSTSTNTDSNDPETLTESTYQLAAQQVQSNTNRQPLETPSTTLRPPGVQVQPSRVRGNDERQPIVPDISKQSEGYPAQEGGQGGDPSALPPWGWGQNPGYQSPPETWNGQFNSSQEYPYPWGNNQGGYPSSPEGQGNQLPQNQSDNQGYPYPGIWNNPFYPYNWWHNLSTHPGKNSGQGNRGFGFFDPSLLFQPGNLTCYECWLDFRLGPYQGEHPCLGRHNGLNVSINFLVTCGINDTYCETERTEVRGILLYMRRGCASVCRPGCLPLNQKTGREVCSSCCTSQACNHVYPPSTPPAASSTIIPSLFLLLILALHPIVFSTML